MWLPSTRKVPGPGSLRIPCEPVPSPQLMVAAKSLIVALRLASLKAATVLLKAEPTFAAKLLLAALLSVASPTVMVPVAVAVLAPTSWIATLRVKLPSSP